MPAGVVLHRRIGARSAVSARYIWSGGGIRRCALQRALSARVVLSCWFCCAEAVPTSAEINQWFAATIRTQI